MEMSALLHYIYIMYAGVLPLTEVVSVFKVGFKLIHPISKYVFK